jgi:phosphate/sulfate permease
MVVFQVIVGLLFVLATIDLVVGVSNDAVNFLNSAVGSRAASFRTILIIASAGVLLGTLFSSGMMQIARNGIFQPEFFTFDKIMIIFLAVMLTDIILLDVYNTLGLPTSTTVSLIFELLGASFTVGVLFLIDQGKPLAEFENVLNYQNAFIIIGGIFFSVFVAFIAGTFIHFFSRLLFTFRLKKSVRQYGAAFTGLAVTIIVYFLLIKGLEGSSLVSPTQLNWIEEETFWILIVSFIAVSFITALLMRLTRFNPLRMIVLLGTFSLAMAFAGNDLVNFMGISVAAYSSYQLWLASGLAPEAFGMDALNEQIATPNWILLVAGFIMLITLWVSVKSRNVTETEVSLGRQEEGDEKFRANLFSRVVVGGVLFAGKVFSNVFPLRAKEFIKRRLHKPNKKKTDTSSFDMLRASINLIVSSALIALGTSKKLPLSTTFVTFMVAMGTSFADQAWGRESAVYRVSGVVSVISGWVITAVLAFMGSAIIALTLFFTGFYGVIVVSLVAFAFLIASHFSFKRQLKEEADPDAFVQKDTISVRELLEQSKLNTAENLFHLSNLLSYCWNVLRTEKQKQLKKQKSEMKKIAEQNKRISNKIIKYIRKTEAGGLSTGRLNLIVFDLLQDLYQSGLLISDVCSEHVSNLHTKPGKAFLESLHTLEKDSTHYFQLIQQDIEHFHFINSAKVNQYHEQLAAFLAKCLDTEILLIQQDAINNRLATLQTRILLEMTDIIETCHRLYVVHQDFMREQSK